MGCGASRALNAGPPTSARAVQHAPKASVDGRRPGLHAAEAAVNQIHNGMHTTDLQPPTEATPAARAGEQSSTPAAQPITLLPPPATACKSWTEVQAALGGLGLLRASGPQAPQNDVQGLQGVSITFMHHFSTIIDASLTTSEVIRDIIRPALQQSGCPRFIDLLVPEQTLAASSVASHWRGGRLKDTLQAICHHVALSSAQDLKTAGAQPLQACEQKAVWIDIFCSRHITTADHGAPDDCLQEVSKAVATAGSVLLVLSDSHATAFTRLWVVWEVMQAAGLGTGSLHVAGPTSFSHLPPELIPSYPSITQPPQPLHVHTADDPSLVARSLKASLAACVTPRDELHVSHVSDGPALQAALQASGIDLDAAADDPTSLQYRLAVVLKTWAEQQVQALIQLAVGFQKPAVSGPDGALERSSDSRLSKLDDAAQQQRGSATGSATPGVFDPEMVGALRVSDALLTAGLILQVLHCWASSEAALKRCLQLRGKVLGGACLPTARAYVSLGRVLVESGQEVLAEPLLRKGIAHLKAVLGKQHPEVGDATSSLGTLLVKQGQVEEAEQALRHALKLQTAGRGADHPASLATAAHLAAVYRDQNKLEEAAQLYRTVLATLVKAHGLLHAQVAITAGHLAWVLQVQGCHEEALPLAEQAAHGMVHAHGPSSAAAGVAKANLGHLLHHLGRNQEAYTLLQESLDILLATLGEGHPDTQAARQHVADLEQHMMASKTGIPQD